MVPREQFLQLLLLLTIKLFLTSKPALTHCLDNERQALLEFKNQLIDEFDRLSSWSIQENKRDCCKWIGIHCNNKTNHITKLDLRGQVDKDLEPIAPIKGTITPSLLELHQLRYLDLSFNDFDYAPFPEFIGSFTKLKYLNLSNSNFGGNIPTSLGNLSRLMYLDLRSSGSYCYSGNLDWLSSLRSLIYLDLSFVDLSNSTNWLNVISELTLKELHLGGSFVPSIRPSLLPFINVSTPLSILDLSGNTVPLSTVSWFLNFSSSFTSINLLNNNLSGQIPDDFGKMESLTRLDLSLNQFHSGVPKSFGNMSSLVYLNLYANHLTGQISELTMNLSGPLENKLQFLDLRGNQITGPLPNISRFSFLKELKLGTNQLNGEILQGSLKLPNLRVLDLSSNKITGQVPDLSFSSFLKELYLDRNLFNGSLTKSIGSLSKLEVLFLGSNHLDGIITEAHLLNLSQLQLLDLSLNSFLTINCSSDWIPPFQLKFLSLASCKMGPHFPNWFKEQKELVHLDLSDAEIFDTIPRWIANLAPKLSYLNISNNQIYRFFPMISFSTYNTSLAKRMTLDISRNRISGTVNFLCHGTDWSLIDLSDNLFSNQLPNCFANFQKLEYLNLANNNFSGKIPNSFGSLSSLSWLHLRNNSFSGGIPNSMKNCTNLQMIDLGENRLTGKLPTWIGNSLVKLVVLIIRSNNFNHTIHPNLCTLQHIQVLDLSINNLSGTIPKCLHNLTAMTEELNLYPFFVYYIDLPILSSLMTEYTGFFDSEYLMWKGNEVKYINVALRLVKLIDLSSNKLSGEIAPEITKLVGLIGLNFSRNNLTGSIPKNIGNLNSLNFLDFSRNYLFGNIPQSVLQLSHLGVMDLAYNNLSGRIPFGGQLQTFDESVYEGNLGLCGEPVKKICPGDEIRPDPKITNGLNDLEVEDDEIITEGFYISMGIGFATGFWGILGTILLNKSFRYTVFNFVSGVQDYVCLKMELSKTRLMRRVQNP